MSSVALRDIRESDVDRVFDWVSKPWYIDEFAGSAMPTPDAHKTYFESILGGGVCFLAVEFEGIHVGNAGVKNINNAQVRESYPKRIEDKGVVFSRPCIRKTKQGGS